MFWCYVHATDSPVWGILLSKHPQTDRPNKFQLIIKLDQNQIENLVLFQELNPESHGYGVFMHPHLETRQNDPASFAR